MKLNDIKLLYKKYQLVFTLAVSTLLFFISTFWNPAIYIASVFILISYIFSSIEDIFAYSFYFMLFSGVIVFYVVLAVGTFLVVFIKYIVDVCRKKVPCYKYPLIATTIIVAIFSIIHYNVNDYGAFQGLLIVALFYIVYVMFCYRKQINIKKLFNTLLVGILVSAVLSLALYFIPSAKVFVFDDWDYNFISVHDKVFLIFKKYKRLQMFSYHPNHLASFCMFLVAYGIYNCITDKSYLNFKTNKKESYVNSLMIIVGSVAGFLTISKAFFIIFVIEVIYVFLYLIIHYKKQSVKLVLIALGILAVCCFVFRHQIIYIIERLFPNNSSTSINDITTGRVDIWKKFLQETLSSPLKLIFGEGLFTTDVVDIGPHSIYIAVIFRFGIVGILMLAGLVYTYIISCDCKLKIDLKKILPLLVFLVYSIQEANIDERFFFLIISIMLLFNNKNNFISEKLNAENSTTTTINNELAKDDDGLLDNVVTESEKSNQSLN